MLLIYLVRLNINESQCNWLWIKVNQSEWHKFQLIQLIEIDQIEKKQFQWTGSISLTRSNWHNWINWCNMTMENKLTDSQKPGLLVQEHPQDQSIHLPHMKMVHFKPSMTPFLVGYLSIDTIESSEICGYEETIAKTKSMPSHPSSELSNLKHVTCSTLYQLKQFVTEDAWDKHSKNHWHHKCCKRWHDSPIIDITCHWQIDPIDNKLTQSTNWPNCTTCKQVIWKIC